MKFFSSSRAYICNNYQFSLHICILTHIFLHLHLMRYHLVHTVASIKNHQKSTLALDCSYMWSTSFINQFILTITNQPTQVIKHIISILYTPPQKNPIHIHNRIDRGIFRSIIKDVAYNFWSKIFLTFDKTINISVFLYSDMIIFQIHVCTENHDTMVFLFQCICKK